MMKTWPFVGWILWQNKVEVLCCRNLRKKKKKSCEGQHRYGWTLRKNRDETVKLTPSITLEVESCLWYLNRHVRHKTVNINGIASIKCLFLSIQIPAPHSLLWHLSPLKTVLKWEKNNCQRILQSEELNWKQKWL